MKISVDKIKVRPGRRTVKPEAVEELARSMTDIGMINPITVDTNHILVAGLHRLEAAKLLGWTEVDCSVLELDTLYAKVAEIDESLFRTGLTNLELSELLVKRKKIYEELHPERRHGGDRRSAATKLPNWQNDSVKSFAEESARMLGTSPRTIGRHVQIGEKLTSETKKILKEADRNITQQTLEKLTHLKPGQQEEAASLLAQGKIQTVNQYATQQESKTGKGIDNATLYMDAFYQAVHQVHHLIRVFQERRDIYSGILSPQQLKALGSYASETVTALDSFTEALDLQQKASEERRIS